MADFDFDLVVIGAGSAGVRAARVAAGLGARVAIVEAGKLGGTCVNAGCIPKKLLVYAAGYAHEFEDAPGYGFERVRPGFSWQALIENKDREIARLNHVYRRLLDDAGARLLEGRAELIDAHTVEVNARRLRARYLLIATGGEPRIPRVAGVEHAISSDQAFHLPELPRRIAIIGAGYVALEFACMFRALGAEVEVLHHGASILRGFDHETCAHLAGVLTRNGLKLRYGVELRALRSVGRELRAELSDGAAIACDQVLLAVGRTPRTAGFGLERAGVALRADGGVLVDDFGRSSIPHIYAAGDCTGRLALTPVAVAEGQAIARGLFGGATATPLDRDQVPTAVFSLPALAKVGLSEEAARERGLEVDIYRSSFVPLKHRLSGRDEPNLIKLVVERATDRVLGCHMVGNDAPEIVSSFAIAVACGATKSQLDAAIGIHPTAAEELVAMRRPS